MLFKNRTDAAEKLAAKLAQLKWDKNTCVLGLPRGGVPLAVEIARVLQLPWGPFLVKKITAPQNPEYAIGAMVKDGPPMWNERALKTLELTELDRQELVEKTNRKMHELYSRWPAFAKINVEDKTVILVDDGLATGLTMQAAVSALQQMNATRIVIAVPVAARSTVTEFQATGIEVVVLETPEPFYAVGQWYHDFTQISTEEVIKLLESLSQGHTELSKSA